MASEQLEKVRGMAGKLASIIDEHVEAQQYDALRSLLNSNGMPPPEGTRTAATKADGIPAEWVQTPNSDPDKRLLYLHGGGYVIGSLDTHRDLVARIAAATGYAALFLDYRLAPEHPYPAAVDDAVVALRWMHDNGPDGPKPASKTLVAGDSAGGGLTLATLVQARDTGIPLPDAAVTLSAWSDMAVTGETLQTRKDVDPMIGEAGLKRMAELYLGGAPAETPLASPVHAELGGLPPLLMQVGDHEIILADTTRVAERARAAGVDVTLEEWPEMVHVWQQFAGMLPEGQQAIDRIGEWVQAR